MKTYSAELPPLRLSFENNRAVIENEFVRWVHDPAAGGEVTEAVVKNGTGTNMLTTPQDTLCGVAHGPWRRNCDWYETNRAPAENFEAAENPDGTVRVAFSSHLADSTGKLLDAVTVHHTVLYHTGGMAYHTVVLKFAKVVPLLSIRIGTLNVRNTMNMLCVRPAATGGSHPEGQHPCRWIGLEPGKWIGYNAYSSFGSIPLSVLFAELGVEGIQMSLGDDLSPWHALSEGLPGPAYQTCSIYESHRGLCYHALFAPLACCMTPAVVKEGEYAFRYTLALPYVKKNIVPLTLAEGFLRGGVGFENRWPDAEFLKRQKESGASLMRLHNDGDGYRNGIFWRDASYPPYPDGEMKKMDEALARANECGVDVVPYFSAKEYHPESPGFKQDAEHFRRMVFPEDGMLTNYWSDMIFGAQMCLESGWYETRRRTIEAALDHHAFHGCYFDWCMGLECVNPEHCGGKRHWDNDRLADLLEWSRAKAGKDGKLYLHLTYVPSLHFENMADMVLTEESAYCEIFPEMFSPHVHFLNVAPRSICNMLDGKDQTPENIRRLAMVAALHHATLSGAMTDDMIAFYTENRALFDSFTEYERHSAPGEGITRTDSRTAGMSLYWKRNGEALALFANLSDKPQTVDWAVFIRGEKLKGEITLPPLDFTTMPLRLPGF